MKILERPAPLAAAKENIMKYICFILIGLLSLAGCQKSPEAHHTETTLYQYSTLATLLNGVYDGELKSSQLTQHGDFGLGTFNALDGEMVVYEGNVYRVSADGTASVVAPDTKLPFAAVVAFKPDKTIKLNREMNCSELKTYIDGFLPSQNLPYAIRIDALFEYIKTRSVPKQNRPYPPLAEVVKHQAIFEFFRQKGTIIGFKIPAYSGSINAQGYHFHFLTQDRQAGGHLLECSVKDAVIALDSIHQWQIDFPYDKRFYNVNTTEEPNK
jgi:acetolactate decarboxylase